MCDRAAWAVNPTKPPDLALRTEVIFHAILHHSQSMASAAVDVLRAALTYFAIFWCSALVLTTMRTLFLAPFVGYTAANALVMPPLGLVVYRGAQHVTEEKTGGSEVAKSSRARAVLGALALVLVVVADAVFTSASFNKT